jgi:hypothetical protein
MSSDNYDIYYRFTLSNTNSISSGHAHIIEKSTNKWSDELPLTGGKTAVFSGAPLSFNSEGTGILVEWAKPGSADLRPSIRTLPPERRLDYSGPFDFTPSPEMVGRYKELLEALDTH